MENLTLKRLAANAATTPPPREIQIGMQAFFAAMHSIGLPPDQTVQAMLKAADATRLVIDTQRHPADLHVACHTDLPHPGRWDREIRRLGPVWLYHPKAGYALAVVVEGDRGLVVQILDQGGSIKRSALAEDLHQAGVLAFPSSRPAEHPLSHDGQ